MAAARRTFTNSGSLCGALPRALLVKAILLIIIAAPGPLVKPEREFNASAL